MDYASEIVKIVREEQAEQAAKLAAAKETNLAMAAEAERLMELSQHDISEVQAEVQLPTCSLAPDDALESAKAEVAVELAVESPSKVRPHPTPTPACFAMHKCASPCLPCLPCTCLNSDVDGAECVLQTVDEEMRAEEEDEEPGAQFQGTLKDYERDSDSPSDDSSDASGGGAPKLKKKSSVKDSSEEEEEATRARRNEKGELVSPVVHLCCRRAATTRPPTERDRSCPTRRTQMMTTATMTTWRRSRRPSASCTSRWQRKTFPRRSRAQTCRSRI